MRFDDRLLTVLNQPAGEDREIAVRWRQLVDLVARAGSSAGSPIVEQAVEAIQADAPSVDTDLRAAAARAVAALPLPLRLLEYFASEKPAVAAPVLAAATLEPVQWRTIMHSADADTRRFIETLHPDLRGHEKGAIGLAEEARGTRVDDPELIELTTTVPPDEIAHRPAAEADEIAAPAPSLHDVVERIERRRLGRAVTRNTNAPSVDDSSSVGLFRWECGPSGDISWMDGAPRGGVIGRSIARASDGDRLDPEVVRAFAMRAPFRDATLSVAGDGAVSGEWKISGVPAFDPGDGRFLGYRGIALRERHEGVDADSALELLPDPDSLRELVHEIKTPLNAIIGFAEIIDGQYLGPADQQYREQAREIVRQARVLVTAIDDLDFAAKLHSSPAGDRRVDLDQLVKRMVPTLKETALERAVDLDVAPMGAEAIAATEPELAERLIFRLCSTVIGRAEAGEQLRLAVTSGERMRVCLTRPASLASLSEEDLLGSPADLDQGFPLRLVRGLARLAGAELTATEGSIGLLFPRS